MPTAGSWRKHSLLPLVGCWAQGKQALTFPGSLRGSDSGPKEYMTMGTADAAFCLLAQNCRQDTTHYHHQVGMEEHKGREQAQLQQLLPSSGHALRPLVMLLKVLLTVLGWGRLYCCPRPRNLPDLQESDMGAGTCALGPPATSSSAD